MCIRDRYSYVYYQFQRKLCAIQGAETTANRPPIDGLRRAVYKSGAKSAIYAGIFRAPLTRTKKVTLLWPKLLTSVQMKVIWSLRFTS